MTQSTSIEIFSAVERLKNICTVCCTPKNVNNRSTKLTPTKGSLVQSNGFIQGKIDWKLLRHKNRCKIEQTQCTQNLLIFKNPVKRLNDCEILKDLAELTTRAQMFCKKMKTQINLVVEQRKKNELNFLQAWTELHFTCHAITAKRTRVYTIPTEKFLRKMKMKRSEC